MSITTTNEELHRAIEQMMLQIMQHYQSTEISGTLHLAITCSADAATRGAHVTFSANIGYSGNDHCKSDNLFEAYNRALRRKQEDLAHQPRLLHVKEPRETANE